MAQLLVDRKTVQIDQENVCQRSVGEKHRRTPNDLLPSPLSSATKRRALVSITNQPLAREQRQANFMSTKSRPPLQQDLHETLDQLIFGSSFLCPENVATALCPQPVQPVGREVCLSTSSGSMCFSTSLRSFGSPGSFGSPMHLSSPDGHKASLMCMEVIDIDLLEDNNCAVCGEYAKDIFVYLKEAEVQFHPRPNYMNKQPDIAYGMRAILVDWLVEVAGEFRLDPQTLYLSVSIVDRFLSSMSVMRSKLQLVGTASMYLASKFEEIYPPEIGDFAYITDDTYTKSQIVKMERLILSALDFRLVAPTPYTFLLRFLKAAEAEQLQTSAADSMELITHSITALAKYLCELALQDGDPYLKYYPSVIAASAVCLSRHAMGQVAWPPILQHYSGYMVADIGNCLQDLHRTFALAHRPPQQAIRQKYSSEMYMKVATFKAPETLPC